MRKLHPWRLHAQIPCLAGPKHCRRRVALTKEADGPTRPCQEAGGTSGMRPEGVLNSADEGPDTGGLEGNGGRIAQRGLRVVYEGAGRGWGGLCVGHGGEVC